MGSIEFERSHRGHLVPFDRGQGSEATLCRTRQTRRQADRQEAHSSDQRRTYRKSPRKKRKVTDHRKTIMRKAALHISKFKPSIFQGRLDFEAVSKRQSAVLAVEYPLERILFTMLMILLVGFICAYFYFVAASV